MVDTVIGLMPGGAGNPCGGTPVACGRVGIGAINGREGAKVGIGAM